MDVADKRRNGRVKGGRERVAVEGLQSAGRVGLGLLAALHLALDCDQPCGRGPVGRGPGGVGGLGFVVGRAGGTERGFVAGLLCLGPLEDPFRGKASFSTDWRFAPARSRGRLAIPSTTSVSTFALVLRTRLRRKTCAQPGQFEPR